MIADHYVAIYFENCILFIKFKVLLLLYFAHFSYQAQRSLQ